MQAIVFPGQGSQSVGMLQMIASQSPLIQATFEEASKKLNYDLWALTQVGPAEKLNQTEFTQPALLTASVALYRWLTHTQKIKPICMAGHSLGEYTALVCAEALAFEDAVKLVEMRGRFMQDAVAVGQGAMAAIVGLSDAQVEVICKLVSTPASWAAPANYNADVQIVIAGHVSAIELAMAEALKQGAKLAKRLPMSVPSHCDLMKPAAKQLENYLKNVTFKTPIVPIIHNVDVAEQGSSDAIKTALIKQLDHPVRWADTIRAMVSRGVTEILECGPGKVLTGLCKRITPGPDSAVAVESYLCEEGR